MSLDVESVAKSFGAVHAIQGIDLAVARGEFFTLLGPSGCGKTTLLRTVAGIYPVDEGRIRLDGRDITRAPMHRRNLAMVFQNYALFPHLTAFENVAFGLRSRRVAAAEIRQRVGEALALVKLGGFERRFPSELSGGQQQRVALARALVVHPDLLLLDEPLSNLDARLRDEMRFEIRDLQRRIGITTVLVTHDIEEAFAMSDRIAVMQGGRIVQIGEAQAIYRRPANHFVACFVGPANELPLRAIEAVDGRARGTAGDGLTVWLPRDALGHRADGCLILRPEHLRVAQQPLAADNSFAADVEDMVFLGSASECRLRLGSLRLTAALSGTAAGRIRAGERVHIGWNCDDAVVVAAA